MTIGKRGRPEEQHLATRSAAGVFDLSFMGLFELVSERALGERQSRALYGMVPGQIAYTLLLNDDGGVFGDATVWQMGGERYWLWTRRRSDFERFRGVACDRSGELAVLALQGPRSGVILETVVGRTTIRALRYFHFVQKESILLARVGCSGELGYELVVPAAERDSLWNALVRAGAVECGSEAMDSLRIEAGFVLAGREMDGKANPRELGLERLVVPPRKFSLNKKLVGFEIGERPADGPLPAGILTSECFSPTLQRRIGLGFVPPDAQGDVRLADGRAARIATLPFYDPKRRRPREEPL